MMPLLLATALSVQAAPAPAGEQVAVTATAAPSACIGGLCDADRLRPFLTKLAAARAGGRPVRIVQIGDSHTAGDQITGTWRTLLQTRYGSGGRGILPPGRPYAGYLTRGITARQSAGWTVSGIFGAAWRGEGSGPIGLAAYSQTGGTGATMGLSATTAELFDRFTVCAMRGPGAGTLALTAGSVSVTWSLADSRVAPDCRAVDAPAVTDNASLTVVQGPVTLTSWATERRDGGGVVLSNLGTVGAQFMHYDRVADTVARRELQDYAPDLIVIAFGTNDAFWPSFTASGYDAMLQAGIRRIQRLAPGVPILLVGAPDSATKIASLQAGPAGVSPACDPGLPGAADGSPWRPTAALAVVQATQRARAHDLGLAYWDWSARMGGRCTADGWSRQTPPLMRGDHVHFTTPGAAIIAGRLQQDIDAAVAAYAATPAGGDAR